MTHSPSDDPLPAYIFASWVSFLIPASYLAVHGPDFVTDGIVRLTYLVGEPQLLDGKVVAVTRSLSGILLVVINAVLFSGFLLFSFAPPAEGSRMGTYVGAFAVCTLCGLLFPFSAWVWGGVWETRMAAGLFAWLAWLLYLKHSIGIARALQRPFVLFFRRFDSFADLSVLPSLLRLTPHGVPVVMLVSGMENEIGYWDPVKLTTYGLRATVPWGGRPVFLRGGGNWEAAMESLVDRSTVVVMDHTERSDALNKEIQTVTRAGRPLILLSEKRQDLEGEATPGSDVQIAYQRGRGAFTVRAGLLALIIAMTVHVADLPRQLREKAASDEIWSGVFGAAIMLGFVSVIFGGLLLRFGITGRVSRKLAGAMRAQLGASSHGAREQDS